MPTGTEEGRGGRSLGGRRLATGRRAATPAGLWSLWLAAGRRAAMGGSRRRREQATFAIPEAKKTRKIRRKKTRAKLSKKENNRFSL